MGGISEQRRVQMLETEIKGLGDWAYQWFLEMLAAGQAPVFAHMCVMRESPSIKNSDKAFNEGQRRNMNNMGDMVKDRMLAAAHRAGINTHNKYHVSGLGSVTDPMSWVSTASDVLEVCRKKNLTATGVVNHKGTPMPPPKKDLAPDIVADRARRMVAADPKLAEQVKKGKVSSAELSERVRAKHQRRP